MKNMRTYAWYKLHGPLGSGDDEDDVIHAAEQVKRIIHRELGFGIPSTRIAVGGFNQVG
jgi:hypothetical protein